MNHPYEEYQRRYRPIWDSVQKELQDAENNGDIVLQTAIEYIVGPIVKEVIDMQPPNSHPG